MPIQLLPQFSAAARAGGNCSFCGRGPGKVNKTNPMSPNRPIVTSDVMIEMEGVFEFCVDCATEIGSVVGMITEDKATEIREDAAHARSRAIAAESERDAARKALDALSADYATRPPAPAPAAAAAAPVPARKAPARKAAAGG